MSPTNCGSNYETLHIWMNLDFMEIYPGLETTNDTSAKFITKAIQLIQTKIIETFDFCIYKIINTEKNKLKINNW